LHGHGAKGGAFARLAARDLRLDARNVATFYTPHGGSLHYPPASPQGLIYTAIEKFLVRYTDGLIFESDFIRRVFNRRVGARGVPERVVPNALQPDDFTPHEPRPDAADFLFIGELRRLKGVDVLLQALARLQGSRAVRAVIVGAGPEATEFKSLADELGLGSLVTFPGAMPARTAFPLGRSLVVPSRAESMPYIVLEAAAAGMPLIATNVGGIPEIVNGTDTPLMSPGDVEVLERAMQGFLADPSDAKARAERLKAAVAARFTVGRAADEVLAFYSERLGR
jgi:glycosyltransferase involved in cell wall biosynthesis